MLIPLSGNLAASHATALLRKFGSIAGIAAARKRELAEVLGADSPLPTYIAAVRRLLRAGLCEHVRQHPLDTSDPALLHFVAANFSGLKHEELLVIWGDAYNRFIDHQTLVSGPSERIEFSPAVLFRRAILAGAKQIVLAHNHPSGVAHPSEEDIATTHRIRRDAGLLGITLRDHLIVGGNQVFSMQRAGLL